MRPKDSAAASRTPSQARCGATVPIAVKGVRCKCLNSGAVKGTAREDPATVTVLDLTYGFGLLTSGPLLPPFNSGFRRLA